MNTTDNLEWEENSCDWCGSTETEFIFKGPDRLERLPGTFTMVRCTRCGLYRQNPRLIWTSLEKYYPEDYSSHPRLVKDIPNAWRRLDRRYGPWKRIRAIESFQKGGRLLEVGCGTGYFLEEALRSPHWDVSGIEPTTKAAEYAQQNLPANIYKGRFSDVDLPSEYFDVIAMWNVLEHLDHPIADLKYAYHLLKDSGWLVLAVPNLESLEAKIFNQFWVGWDLPRHLYIFPRDLLDEILVSIGFKVITRRCISTSYSVLGHSLDFWSQSWEMTHPKARNILLSAYYSIIGRVAMIFPLWFLDRLKTSTIVTVFAQKHATLE